MTFQKSLSLITKEISEEEKLNFDGYFDNKKEVFPRIKIEIHLNKMKMTYEIKKNMVWEPQINRRLFLDEDTDIHEEILSLHLEYIEKKDIEDHWRNELRDMKIIEILDDE